MDAKPKIAIIGAGVVGLTVAHILQKTLRGGEIVILADKLREETTSWVAAGIFRPGTNFSGASEELTRAYIKKSWNYWNDLYLTSEAPKAGVTMISGYMFSNNDPDIVRNYLIEGIVPEYRPATEEELKICPGDWKYGSFSTTLLIDDTLYLPWAEERFLENGGLIAKRKINSFDDVGEYDLVINCSGFGAKKLCKDNSVTPIRGQVIKVKAPWLKTFFYNDYDTYILPGFEYVTLGGTRQYDSYNTDVCKHDSDSIWERAIRLVPALKNAPIVNEAVGLRPYRPTVRVEREDVQLKNGKKLKLVHCYGHGGYGVTSAPGTAQHAVELAIQMLSKSYSKL